jgi:hypothetical protein
MAWGIADSSSARRIRMCLEDLARKAAVQVDAIALTIFAAVDNQYNRFHNVNTSRKWATAQLTMKIPKSQNNLAKGSFRRAWRANQARIPEMNKYDRPITESASALVHTNLLSPARQN